MSTDRKAAGFVAEEDTEHILIRRPAWIRLLGGLLTLFLMPLALLLLFVGAIAGFTGPTAQPGIGLMVLALGAMLAGLTLLALTLTGPCQLNLDLRNRTYRMRRGLPLVASESTGSFDEFDYLYLRQVVFYNYGARSPESRIYLVWKAPKRLYGFMPQPEFLLQLLYTLEPAAAQAEQFATILGLPLEEGRRKRGAVPVRPAVTAVPDPPPAAVAPEPQPTYVSTRGERGRVVRQDGPVLDVAFDPARQPDIYNLLTISGPSSSEFAATVAQRLPAGMVRCILNNAGASITPGQEAVDTGFPGAESAACESLQEAIAVFGRTRVPEATLLETGIKAIDLLCPIPRDGKVGLFSDWGVGTMVLVPEVIRAVQSRPGGIVLFTILRLQVDPGRWHSDISEAPQVSGEKECVYLQADNPDDAQFRAQFVQLDAVIHTTRALAKRALYPPVDPLTSRSRLLDEAILPDVHVRTASAVRDLLGRYAEIDVAVEALGIESLPEVERLWAARARKLERFLAQPYFVAEPYTGLPGKSVSIADTLAGCQAILAGSYDATPEQALYMIGAAEESVEKHRLLMSRTA